MKGLCLVCLSISKINRMQWITLTWVNFIVIFITIITVNCHILCRGSEEKLVVDGGLEIAQIMKFSVKDFFSTCDILNCTSYLMKKSLMENFIFCVVTDCVYLLSSHIIYIVFRSAPFRHPQHIFWMNYIDLYFRDWFCSLIIEIVNERYH